MTGERGAGRRGVVHGYAGHPFQVHLSRALASRGHEVLHLHYGDFQTPKGPLARRNDDPQMLPIEGLTVGEPFEKYRFERRLTRERRYGSILAQRIADHAPLADKRGCSPGEGQTGCA